MSTTLPQSYAWSKEVMQHARDNKVEQYLQPLWNAVRELFPTAQRIDVYVYSDPELRDVHTILFEVDAPLSDVPDYVAARRAWSEKLFAICPAPLVHHFGLHLQTV